MRILLTFGVLLVRHEEKKLLLKSCLSIRPVGQTWPLRALCSQGWATVLRRPPGGMPYHVYTVWFYTKLRIPLCVRGWARSKHQLASCINTLHTTQKAHPIITPLTKTSQPYVGENRTFHTWTGCKRPTWNHNIKISGEKGKEIFLFKAKRTENSQRLRTLSQIILLCMSRGCVCVLCQVIGNKHSRFLDCNIYNPQRHRQPA
jgi:hypothetical protein